MGIARYLVFTLAIILCGSINQTVASFLDKLSTSLSAYDKMQCLLHEQSDAVDSCLLGGRRTPCTTYKCFRTIGQTCTTGNDAKLIGGECGESLMCGCDKKCNGCMNINGETKCHHSRCMSIGNGPLGKRDQSRLFPLDLHDRYNDYQGMEDSMTV